MDSNSERIIKNLNTTAVIRKAFLTHKHLEKNWKDSLQPAQSLVKTVLSCLSLKDKKFEIYPPSTDDDSLLVFDPNIKTLESSTDIKKFHKFLDFFNSHCTAHAYIVQVRKCSNPLCSFHKEMRGTEEIQVFPDPVPVEDDGVQHYSEGIDPEEKYLPSKLQNV